MKHVHSTETEVFLIWSNKGDIHQFKTFVHLTYQDAIRQHWLYSSGAQLQTCQLSDLIIASASTPYSFSMSLTVFISLVSLTLSKWQHSHTLTQSSYAPVQNRRSSIYFVSITVTRVSVGRNTENVKEDTLDYVQKRSRELVIGTGCRTDVILDYCSTAPEN